MAATIARNGDDGVTAGHVVAGVGFGAAVGAALGLIPGAADRQGDPARARRVKRAHARQV